jgi:N-glycosylase/DNA lyase
MPNPSLLFQKEPHPKAKMDIKTLKKYYNKRKKIVKKRLKEFSQLKDDDLFYEFCFCILTPQSNALKCHECVCALRKKDFIKNSLDIKPLLRNKTRFYKNKSSYLIYNKARYDYIKNLVNNKNKKNIIKNRAIREELVAKVKGYGYKEASHFLRNIGYTNLAILDRHILKNLLSLGVIKELPKSLSKKEYLSIENKFLHFAKKIKIPMDELDLLFWSIETGKVFK